MVEDEWRWELREKSDEEHELDDLRAELDRLRAIEARAGAVLAGTRVEHPAALDAARYILDGA